MVNAASVARAVGDLRDRYFLGNVDVTDIPIYQPRRAAWVDNFMAQMHQDEESIARAESLLLEHLTPEQRETWQRTPAMIKHIKVKGNITGKVYTLVEGGPVKRDDGRRYCIQSTRTVPEADAVLARKLLLETDEAEFLRIANDITAGIGGIYGPINLPMADHIEAPTEVASLFRIVMGLPIPENEIHMNNARVFCNPPWEDSE